MGLTDLWAQLVDCICRPPRDVYTLEDLPGGAGCTPFKISVFGGIRKDVVIANKKGQQLQCSHFIPTDAKGKGTCRAQLPCVIYCHCNSGSRRDAEEAVYVLVPLGVSVFALDFAGSGLSDGEYVTLGAHEVDDVEAAVEYLRSTGGISTLGLWGRSMGAVTALMYSQRDPSIAGVVVDSPFSRLTDLMLEIVEEQNLPVPRPFFKMALAAMKRSVKKKAGFDLEKVCPIEVVPNSFIPALFGHATDDTFIKISHSERLHAAYAGDKNLIRFEGDHNSRRPEFFYSSVSVFFHNTLQLEQVLEGGNRLDAELRRALQVQGRPATSPAAVEGTKTSAAEARPAVVPPAVEAAASSQVQRNVGDHMGRERVELDAWGDQARATMTRVLNGTEPSALVDDADEDDAEQVALVKAIQLSLLEMAKNQQQQQQQQQEEGRNEQTGPLRAGALGHTEDAAMHLLQRSPGWRVPGTSESKEVLGSGSASQLQQKPPKKGSQDSTLLHSRPLTPEQEEAMLAEAIRLSLQEASGEVGTSRGPASNAAVGVAPGVQHNGGSADATGQQLSPAKSYVDQLCDELGDGLVSPTQNGSGAGRAAAQQGRMVPKAL